MLDLFGSKIVKVTLLFLSFCFLIIACSSMSKQECLQMDWYEKGRSNAMSGQRELEAAVLKKQCSQHSVMMDFTRYKKGFLDGLKSYCTRKRAYDLGIEGEKEHVYCQRINKKFADSYFEGYKQYKTMKAQNDAASELEDRKKTARENLRASILNEYMTTSCSFDSDCGANQRCERISRYTEFNEEVQLNICR